MLTDFFTLCLQTFLQHVYRYSYTIFTNMFISYLKMCEDIFTQYWKTCLCCAWRHVHTMFTEYLSTHLHHAEFLKIFLFCLKACKKNIWKHLYIIFEDMFAPSLKNTGLCLMTLCVNIFSHVYLQWIVRHVHTIFEDKVIFIKMDKKFKKVCLKMIQNYPKGWKGLNIISY